MDLLRPLLLRQNPHLTSLKVDCDRLNDSAIEILLCPSLRELCLYNCADFNGKLLSEIGTRCPDLRFGFAAIDLSYVIYTFIDSKKSILVLFV